jgi:hypothetical protein
MGLLPKSVLPHAHLAVQFVGDVLAHFRGAADVGDCAKGRW